MNQKEIVIPLSCKKLFLIVWGILFTISIIYLVNDSPLEHWDTPPANLALQITSFMFVFVSGIGMGVWGLFELVEWLIAEPRLPFRIRCKCGGSDND